ncbi:TetR/AcrR family transcriptional regulator [Methylobacillus arboreus]|uniref:TetR/AcrR family transcriptional regulator n=1 Tax=Methylobacillus arboreus TaxID=755170 RepID=UPI001E5EA80C|nr:TetR/AcrR family transcriptional regulator [Methylobacillus arboreus]MCB5191525.1 TetR/AcrR family transcriptional regulator [Methylobacillus arboreus]
MSEMNEIKRPYHHGDLKRTIIETALQMLRESEGWQFTLREIARRAEVSHAAPYKHFPDKSALLAELALIGFDQLRADLENSIAPFPDSPIKQLSSASRAYIQFGETNPSHYKLMFSSDAGVKPNQVHLNERAMSTLGVLLDILRRGQIVGAFKKKPVEAQAAACWAQVHGLTLLSIDGLLLKEKVGENAAEAALRTLLEGLQQ